MYPISNNRFVLTQHIQNSSCSIRKPKSIMSCADVRSSVVSTHIFYNKLFAWLIYFTVVSELTPWDHGMEMVIWSIWSGITEKRHTCAFVGGYISWRINNGERTWRKKNYIGLYLSLRIIRFMKLNPVFSFLALPWDRKALETSWMESDSNSFDDYSPMTKTWIVPLKPEPRVLSGTHK